MMRGVMDRELGELDQFLEEYQVKSNRNLHSKTDIMQMAQKFDAEWALQSTLSSEKKILSTALMSKYFRRGVAFFALCLFLSASISAYTAANSSIVRGRYLRFVPKDPLPPDCSIDVESIVFRYEERNCEWPPNTYKVSANDGVLTFSFKDIVGVTGWSVRRNFCRGNYTAQGNQPEVLTIRENDLILQRSYDGSQWQVLSLPWLKRLQLPLRTVDLRPSHCWIACEIVAPVVLSMFMFAGCFKGVCGEGNAGAKLISLGWFTSFCMIYLAAWSDGSQDPVYGYAAYAIYSVLSFMEYKIVEVCVLIWMVQLTSVLFFFRIDLLVNSSGLLHFLEAPTKLCLTLAGLTLIICRFRYREQLRRMVENDRKRLASTFQGIANDANLSRLADECDEIARGLNTDAAALRQPTRNLMQLRAQAAALQILMDSKLSSWSSFSSFLDEPNCTAKSAEINTVKLFACLDGDSAKLFDYCAGNLVFDDICRLLLCLKVIKGDTSVRILRLENSLCLRKHESDTLGYRSVDILLNFVCENAKSLGVEKHICRLTLHHTDLVRLKSKDAYLRELLYRNSSISESPLDACRNFLQNGFLIWVACKNKIYAGWAQLRRAVLGTENSDPPPPLRDNIDDRQEQAVLVPNIFTRTLSWETETPIAADRDGDCYANEPIQSPEHHISEDLLRTVFREHFRQFVADSSLLGRRNPVCDAFADCAGGGAIETSESLLSVFCTRWVIPFYVCLIALILNKFLACLRLLMEDGKCHGRLFRFTPLELRGDPSAVPAEPGIEEFGLLRHGCGIRAASTRADGSSMLADFGEEVKINGWWLTTRDQPAALDPVRFELDVSRDGEAWTRCGASRFDAVFARDQLLGIGWAIGAHDTSLQRGDSVVFSMILPWQFAFDHVLVFLAHLASNGKLVFEVLCGNPTGALCAVLHSYICCSVLYLTSAVGYALEGDLLACSVQATYSVYFSSLVFVLKEKRRGVVKYSGRNAFLFAAAGLVQYVAVFGGSRRLIDGYLQVIAVDILTAFGTSALSACFNCYARFLLHRSVSFAKALVAADQGIYNAAWAVCVENDEAVGALRRMEKFIADKWRLRGVEWQPRQRIRDMDIFAQESAIENLQQLIGQAVVLMPFLRTKAKCWALLSEGCFPVLQDDDAGAAGSARFERWEDIARDGEMVQRVKWAKIKSTKRTLEKVYRCYAGELSRLLDCCRCSVVFSELSQVLACLEAIAADGDVEVVRVNNKFAHNYDACITAGYRDVSLNLRIKTERTAALGVDGHICEIQLILLPFARLKTAGGHKKYVLWRNQRGQ